MRAVWAIRNRRMRIKQLLYTRAHLFQQVVFTRCKVLLERLLMLETRFKCFRTATDAAVYELTSAV